MDGLIEKKTIEYLNLFRKTNDYEVIVNTYTPRCAYTQDLRTFVKGDNNIVL